MRIIGNLILLCVVAYFLDKYDVVQFSEMRVVVAQVKDIVITVFNEVFKGGV